MMRNDAIAGGQDKSIDITRRVEPLPLSLRRWIKPSLQQPRSERRMAPTLTDLEYASDNLMNVAQNTDASRSQIEDADYAAETSELARTQIIAQASTAMLAQANQTKQSVLALLQ